MYNFKDVLKGAAAVAIMFTLLAGVMTLHAMSIAGLL